MVPKTTHVHEPMLNHRVGFVLIDRGGRQVVGGGMDGGGLRKTTLSSLFDHPPSAAENELSYLLGSLLLHVREDVGVRVERDGDIRMTEALTYDLGRDSS